MFDSPFFHLIELALVLYCIRTLQEIFLGRGS